MRKRDLKKEIDELVNERDVLLNILGTIRNQLREALELLDDIEEDEDETPLAD